MRGMERRAVLYLALVLLGLAPTHTSGETVGNMLAFWGFLEEMGQDMTFSLQFLP